MLQIIIHNMSILKYFHLKGVKMTNPITEKMLDKEWEELISLALNAGITVEEIRAFFEQYS